MSAEERLCALCETVYAPDHVPADGRCVEQRCSGTIVQHSGPLEVVSLVCGAASVVAGALASASYMEYLTLVWQTCSIVAGCAAAVGVATSFVRQTRLSPQARGLSALAVGLVYPPFVILTLVLCGLVVLFLLIGFLDQGESTTDFY